MKKLFALLLVFSLTASMFIVPAGAFHVDYVSYSFDFSTNVERIEMLHIEKEDGLTEDISVYDEEGNQLYIQVGENEWEKLDTPLTPAEIMKQEADKKAAEEARKNPRFGGFKVKDNGTKNVKTEASEKDNGAEEKTDSDENGEN